VNTLQRDMHPLNLLFRRERGRERGREEVKGERGQPMGGKGMTGRRRERGRKGFAYLSHVGSNGVE